VIRSIEAARNIPNGMRVKESAAAAKFVFFESQPEGWMWGRYFLGAPAETIWSQERCWAHKCEKESRYVNALQDGTHPSVFRWDGPGLDAMRLRQAAVETPQPGGRLKTPMLETRPDKHALLLADLKVYGTMFVDGMRELRGTLDATNAAMETLARTRNLGGSRTNPLFVPPPRTGNGGPSRSGSRQALRPHTVASQR